MPDTSLAESLFLELQKSSTSSTGYLQGDAANSMWGVPIPCLAFAYLIGGSSVVPGQRYLGLSGAEKSFKSTLAMEIGNWFIANNGAHIHLDTELKIAKGDRNSTVDALSWWNGIAEKRSRIIQGCASVSEWQKLATRTVEFNRGQAADQKKPGSRRPVLVTIDSLSGRQTEDADRDLRREGAAPERGFPVAANQATNYLETLNLLGTTVTVSWVQHMKEKIEQDNGKGKQYKEKGASASRFSCSTHIRAQAAATPVRAASWPTAPFEGVPVEGRTIYLKTPLTCVGPGNRSAAVNILWQYDEDNHQAMWFDWYGALGNLLLYMKYTDKTVFKADKDRLEATLHFTQPSAGRVTCQELGLDKATATEFGHLIETTPELRARVAKFLRITEYPTIQEADIDFGAGTLTKKKK
jgi:hypothetical protein